MMDGFNVKEGDELCISYIDVDQDVDEREEHLRYVQVCGIENAMPFDCVLTSCAILSMSDCAASINLFAIVPGAKRSGRRKCVLVAAMLPAAAVSFIAFFGRGHVV